MQHSIFYWFTAPFIYVIIYTEPYNYNGEENNMIRDKIIEMLKKKSVREQQEVIRLRWKKAELERLINQKKNRQQE